MAPHGRFQQRHEFLGDSEQIVLIAARGGRQAEGKKTGAVLKWGDLIGLGEYQFGVQVVGKRSQAGGGADQMAEKPHEMPVAAEMLVAQHAQQVVVLQHPHHGAHGAPALGNRADAHPPPNPIDERVGLEVSLLSHIHGERVTPSGQGAAEQFPISQMARCHQNTTALAKGVVQHFGIFQLETRIQVAAGQSGQHQELREQGAEMQVTTRGDPLALLGRIRRPKGLFQVGQGDAPFQAQHMKHEPANRSPKQENPTSGQ